MTTISSFNGPYRFLSNFSPSPIMLHSRVPCATVEHAYQASKAESWDDIIRIASAATPGDSKRAGRSVKLRADWEAIKIHVMHSLLQQKFSLPQLREKLLATSDAELVEGNTWGDTFWGVCNGYGHNVLGQLLMQVRSEIRNVI